MQYASSVTNMNIVVQQMVNTVQPFIGIFDNGMAVAAEQADEAVDKIKELEVELGKIDKVHVVSIEAGSVDTAIEKVKQLNSLMERQKAVGSATAMPALHPDNPASAPSRDALRSSASGPAAVRPAISGGAIQVTSATNSMAGIGDQVNQLQSLSEGAKGSTAAIEQLNDVQASKQAPTAKEITDHLATFVDLMGKASEVTTQLGIDTSAVQPVIDSLGKGIELVSVFTDLYTTAQWLLNAAMDANPVTMIIIGVMALVGAIMYAWNKFAGFREAVMGVWEAMKAFGGLLKDYIIDRVKGILSGLGGIAKALYLLFTGEFSQAFDTGKQALSDLSGSETTKKFVEDVATKVPQATAKGSSAQQAAEKSKPDNNIDGFNLLPANYNQLLKGQKSALPKGPNLFATAQQMVTVNQGMSNNILQQQASVGASPQAGNITGGGSKAITINISKFFDNLNVTAQNMSEGIDDFERRVEEVFLRIVNSANTVNR